MPREIRMKMSGLGRRMDGSRWPDFNGVAEAEDEVAARFVAAGHAVYLEDEPVPVNPGWNPMLKFSDNYEPALDPDNRAPGEEEDEALDDEDDLVNEGTGVKRPYANASKAAWVEYAVAMGEDRDAAERQSKADLISQHGASL